MNFLSLFYRDKLTFIRSGYKLLFIGEVVGVGLPDDPLNMHKLCGTSRTPSPTILFTNSPLNNNLSNFCISRNPTKSFLQYHIFHLKYLQYFLPFHLLCILFSSSRIFQLQSRRYHKTFEDDFRFFREYP